MPILTEIQINELLHAHSVLLENFDKKEAIFIKLVEDLDKRLKFLEGDY